MVEGTGIGAGTGSAPESALVSAPESAPVIGPAEARMVARRASIVDDPLDALMDITAMARVEPQGDEFYVSVIVRTGTPPDHRSAVFDHLETACNGSSRASRRQRDGTGPTAPITSPYRRPSGRGRRASATPAERWDRPVKSRAGL